MKMRNNWKAEFKDTAGAAVFRTGGFFSPMTMSMPTANTFLGKALVAFEEVDAAGAISLSDVWAKVVVDAPEFGVNSHVFERKDIPAATLKWAKDTAENNMASGPAPTIL